MKIYAPIENVNGVYASVLFVNSVGETDNPALIEWFRSHGYRIEKPLEKCTDVIEKSVEKCDTPDFESMTPNQLRDWMRENGYGGKIRNIKNKDKLLELLRG